MHPRVVTWATSASYAASLIAMYAIEFVLSMLFLVCWFDLAGLFVFFPCFVGERDRGECGNAYHFGDKQVAEPCRRFIEGSAEESVDCYREKREEDAFADNPLKCRG